MDNPFASRTPADFWKRYNRPTQQFFHEDVFKPLGGRRAPIRGTLATFAVSAAVHEYIFDVAVGRFQGYQTAFFLVQGVAVAATLRVRPRGPAAVAWVAATFAFNLATSALFFASVGEVVPFYARRDDDGARVISKKSQFRAFLLTVPWHVGKNTRASGRDAESVPIVRGTAPRGGRPRREGERNPGRRPVRHDIPGEEGWRRGPDRRIVEDADRPDGHLGSPAQGPGRRSPSDDQPHRRPLGFGGR